jgi:hypothetical protein
MRILVCGGRDYANAARIELVLSILGPTLLINGAARGADTLAATWAARNGVPARHFPAAWEQYGKSAGAKRNRQMLREGKPQLVVAFPGGAGTHDMVGAAMQNGVPVLDLTEGP